MTGMKQSDKLVLAINPGSTSRKYALYRGDELLANFHYEQESETSYLRTMSDNTSSLKHTIDSITFQNALADMIGACREQAIDLSQLAGIGVRIVAPGSAFANHRQIDQHAIEILRNAEEVAPLHVRATIEEIKAAVEHLPNIPQFAISDSAFHAGMPDVARRYAIDAKDAQNFDIYRFGYHGISIASVMLKLAEMSAGAKHENVIVCHLGGGASVTAVKNGLSVDTSMGFSPLEGLPMATRAGTVDITAALYLAAQKGFTDDQLLEYLNKDSGLQGLSGTSSDIRLLIKQSEDGDEDAKSALNLYTYHIRRQIGAYHAILGGLNILVFTGTVGLRSDFIRSLVCENLNHLGIVIDETKNKSLQQEGFINAEGKLGIAVIETDEAREIALQTLELLDS
jgi:acetate kinase